MQVREYREDLVRRVRLLLGVAATLLVLIGSTFWSVQIVRGDYYRELADNNRLRKLPIQAPRGLIYDRKGRLLVENVPSYDLLIDRSRASDVEASLDFASGILGRPEVELQAALDRARATPPYKPALVAANLDLGQVGRFEAKRLEHPEFEIDVRQLRLYRHGPRTAHVLGYLGEVSPQEIAASDGLYEAGDQVGKKGIERTYDQRLRGKDGERVVVVDSRGRVLKEYERKKAEPGQALHLTLDLDLQQEAARLMSDKVGAVVALDPRNGAIRALYSAPSYNSNLLAWGLSQAEWQGILKAPNHPLQDRAIQNTYAPGSVFKVVMAAAGLAEGVVDENTTFYCSGSTVIYGRSFRCWRPGGHGRVDLLKALEGSCDIYFYNVGKALGVDRIARYARLFGLGERTGIELEGEKAGLVPDSQWSLTARHHPWYPGETISVAIGQGPILVTPLQVATMMAAVANGGHKVIPHLRAGRRGEAAATEGAGELGLPAGVLDEVRDGLRGVVNSPAGTAHASRLSEVVMAGKTGTVQVVAQSTRRHNEDLPYKLRDHAWFASYAPAGDPRLVVVVFVEHGGEGAHAAAPIAKVLFEKYFGIDDDGDG